MELLEYANTIERFNLNGIETFGKVVSIHDGDTFDLSFFVNLSDLSKEREINKRKRGICFIYTENKESSIMMRMVCRMDGLDARELKSEGGQKAKEIVEEWVKDKILRVRLGNYDKYGRVLIRVFVNKDGQEIELNSYLIQTFKQFFTSYDGGKKINSFDEI